MAPLPTSPAYGMPLIFDRTCGRVAMSQLSASVAHLTLAASSAAAFVGRWSSYLSFRVFAASFLASPFTGTANVDGDRPFFE